jgi:hypothetical protein
VPKNCSGELGSDAEAKHSISDNGTINQAEGEKLERSLTVSEEH